MNAVTLAAPSPHRRRPRRFLALALALFATLLSLTCGYRPAHGGSHEQSDASPQDVICPMSAAYTSQPCYPRIFQSTSDEIYTKVLDGQVVPAGFDVRLDMQSGERWAKLPRGSSKKGDNQRRPPASARHHTSGDIAVVPGQDAHDERAAPRPNTRRQQSAPLPVQFRRQDANQGNDILPYKRPAGGKRRVSAADTKTLQALMTTLSSREESWTLGTLSPSEWEALDELTHQVDHGLDFLTRFSQDRVFGQIADKHSQHPSSHAVMFYRVIGNSLQNNDDAIKHVTETIPDLTAHLIECINWNTHRAGDRFLHPFVSQAESTQLAKSCLYALGSLVRGSQNLGKEFLVEFQGRALLKKWAHKVPEVEDKCRALLEDLSE